MNPLSTTLEYIQRLIALPSFGPAILGFSATFFFLYILKFVVISRLHEFAKQTTTDADDFLVELVEVWNLPAIIGLSLLVFFEFIDISDDAVKVIDTILLIFISFFGIATVRKIIDYSFRKSLKKKSPTDKIFLSALNTAVGIGLYLMLFLVILQNLNIDVTALITGLGIGGIAIAFALQNILGDIFSAFSIYFDKPFAPGDIVMIGTDVGEVQKVGLKSTRIKTLEGEELIVSNQELSNTRIRNFNLMKKRRVLCSLNIKYETNPKLLKKIPQIIQTIVESEENVEFDRAHLAQFADFAIRYEFVYNVLSREYKIYMDAQQTINFKILDEFQKKGIKFAYPTQTVLLNK